MFLRGRYTYNEDLHAALKGMATIRPEVTAKWLNKKAGTVTMRMTQPNYKKLAEHYKLKEICTDFNIPVKAQKVNNEIWILMGE